MRLGGRMIIADGREPYVLERILKQEKTGTLFAGENVHVNSRKKWISMRKGKGTLQIDDGAVKAITETKKSLLAAGITSVVGKFSMGDIVDVADSKGRCIARGIANYSSDELEMIKGRKTAEIRDILGMKYFDEVINRDDMIIL